MLHNDDLANAVLLFQRDRASFQPFSRVWTQHSTAVVGADGVIEDPVYQINQQRLLPNLPLEAISVEPGSSLQ